HDITLHAFYPIPAEELPSVTAQLRELAAIQDVAIERPLDVNLGVTNAGYAAALRDLVLAYARVDRLFKVTVIGQDALSAAFAWRFAGMVRRERVRGVRAAPARRQHRAAPPRRRRRRGVPHVAGCRLARRVRARAQRTQLRRRVPRRATRRGVVARGDPE